MVTDDQDDYGDRCGFCFHLVDDHGTTELGCSECECGYDGDFHPPLGDEKGDQ